MIDRRAYAHARPATIAHLLGGRPTPADRWDVVLLFDALRQAIRDQDIDEWLATPNPAFDGRPPARVWAGGWEGRERVMRAARELACGGAS